MYAAAPFILFLALLNPSALAQQNVGEGSNAPAKAHRILTNDDLHRGASEAPDGLPAIPGLIKCGKDLKCFLPALDKATPAVVTRNEIAKEGTAIVTMDSTWWTTQFAADRCTVSFRVDSLDAKVNPEVVPDDPKVHAAVEARLAEMKRDFESLRGKTETCSVAVKDLKSLLTSSALSLMSLGPASGFGKSCSGPMFEAGKSPRPNRDK